MKHIMGNQEFRIAQAMAQAWVKQRTDVNEVEKAKEYLVYTANGQLFFQLLNTIIRNGWTIIRSKQTRGYYRSIRDVCRQHLKPYQEEPEQMAQILGWAVRLMRYYKVADRLEQPPPRGSLTAPPVERVSGQVKWFNVNKGYGFIRPDSGGKDFFLLHSELPADFKAPPNGARVTFVAGQSPKGPQAKDVQPA